MATQKTFTPEELIALMREFITEVQEKGDTSSVEARIHPDMVDHKVDGPVRVGQDGAKAVIKGLHSGLSDIKVKVIDCVCTGDIVATNKVIYGNHTGDLMGNPATGVRMQLPVMDFVKFKDGKFIEHWANVGPIGPAKLE